MHPYTRSCSAGSQQSDNSFTIKECSITRKLSVKSADCGPQYGDVLAVQAVRCAKRAAQHTTTKD